MITVWCEPRRPSQLGDRRVFENQGGADVNAYRTLPHVPTAAHVLRRLLPLLGQSYKCQGRKTCCAVACTENHSVRLTWSGRFYFALFIIMIIIFLPTWVSVVGRYIMFFHFHLAQPSSQPLLFSCHLSHHNYLGYLHLIFFAYYLCIFQMKEFRKLGDPWDEPNLRNFRTLQEREDRHVFFISPHWNQYNSLLPIPRVPEPSISLLSPAYEANLWMLPPQNAYMLPEEDETSQE